MVLALQTSSCRCLNAALSEVSKTPAQRLSPPMMWLCTPTNSQIGPWGSASSSISTSSSGSEQGPSARGSPNCIWTTGFLCHCPCAKVLGVGVWMASSPPGTCLSQRSTCTWWSGGRHSSSSQSTGMTGHCPRLLFLPVRLPVRTRDRRTLPAWQVKSLLPGRDRPATVLPRADGMLG